MKYLILICCIISSTASTYAQSAAFKGGAGDGYASTQGTFSVTNLPPKATSALSFDIFPNPVKKAEALIIRLNASREEFIHIRLYNNVGKLFTNETISTADLAKGLNLSYLPIGLYLLQISGKNKYTESKKIMIE